MVFAANAAVLPLSYGGVTSTTSMAVILLSMIPCSRPKNVSVVNPSGSGFCTAGAYAGSSASMSIVR